MSTSYGKNICISIYGSSHDDEIGVVAKGLPAGFELDRDALHTFMGRRAPGKKIRFPLREGKAIYPYFCRD